MHDLKAFFDAYRDSFPKGPEAVAAFYSQPCVTARAGIVRVHSSSSDITLLFEAVDKQYRDRGYTHAECSSFDCESLGANSALVMVRWAYKGPDEQTIWETTFSFNVYRRDGTWRILVQTVHDQYSPYMRP
jgi:hypothetical protein